MKTSNDYGADPIGNGKFRMVPSGEIVDLDERNARLAKYKQRPTRNDCLGASWERIEAMQGMKKGALKR